MKSLWTPAVRGAFLVAFLYSTFALAQTAPSPTQAIAPEARATRDSAVRDLQDRDLREEVRQLRSLVEQMRDDNAQSRAEMHELREELRDTRSLLEKTMEKTSAAVAAAATPRPSDASSIASVPSQALPAAVSDQVQTPAATPSSAAAPLEQRIQKLEESTSLLGSKIDEQYQTKVETASKYRARLSGIVLMNAFRNVGASDNLDFPNYASSARTGRLTGQLRRYLAAKRNWSRSFRSHSRRSQEFGECATRFFRRLRLHSQRRRLWHRAPANRQCPPRLATHVRYCRPGFSLHLAAFAHVFRFSVHSCLCLCRKSLGLDSANSRRASLRSFRPADGDRAGGIMDNLDWEPPYHPVLAYRDSRRTLRSARLCHSHRMVPSRV